MHVYIKLVYEKVPLVSGAIYEVSDQFYYYYEISKIAF